MDTLSPGDSHSITQNIVYALPACVVHVTAGAAVEVSVQSTTGFTTLTGANTIGALTSAGFLRSTTGDTIIFVKRY